MIIEKSINAKQLSLKLWDSFVKEKQVSFVAEGDATVKLVSLVELLKRRCNEQKIPFNQTIELIPSEEQSSDTLIHGNRRSLPQLKIDLQILEHDS
ncbi:RNase P and RNase MRP subunit Pop6/Pop7 ortholog [Schizosaccharomyces pombe]|uniref:Uncharacterized protein new2 n=1 Tax=Schizosaccharomyces pombe (strain 972 / ATCC 24843) TaxID=284812 RepID=NEW2_SCHPO|nr:protein new2 [Schizosaccharomyces pombe]G2TRL5.1 RecName: Full=Uncharacterized protein new2 [Schizosaccharomyces pombe 972h-]CCD31320.1 sequence orphan [Schizosaccharomyces pombe]|eukprot:NP_001343110.1 protein new2 [Schizosaccharomyces pombe]